MSTDQTAPVIVNNKPQRNHSDTNHKIATSGEKAYAYQIDLIMYLIMASFVRDMSRLALDISLHFSR